MIFGLFFGCFVSGATFRQPCRASNRQTTDAFTGWPTRCASAARIGERTNKPASWACSAQGFRNSISSCGVRSDFRRPPQFRRSEEKARPMWKRSCSRFTDAVPTPSILAVSSSVRPALAGRRTASADLKSSRLRVACTVRFALATSFKSIWIGLAMHKPSHNYTHLESTLESATRTPTSVIRHGHVARTRPGGRTLPAFPARRHGPRSRAAHGFTRGLYRPVRSRLESLNARIRCAQVEFSKRPVVLCPS